MLKYTRTIVMAAGVAAGGLLLLVASLSFYLNSTSGQANLNQKLNSSIAGDLSWGSLEISLFTGKIEARQLLLANNGGRELARVEHLHLDLSWRSLLWGKIHFQKIELKAPRAGLTRRRDGSLDLLEALGRKRPEAPSSPTRVEMDFLRISNGSFSFLDQETGLSADLGEISLWAETLALSVPRGEIRLEIARGELGGPSFALPLDELLLSARLNEFRLDPIDLRLELGNTRLGLAGSVENPTGTPRVDLSLRGSIDLAEATQIARLDKISTGQVDVNLSVQGDLENPAAELEGRYRGGDILGLRVDKGSFNISLDQFKAAVNTLAFESKSGSFNLSGEFDLTSCFPDGFISSSPGLEEITYQVQARARNFPLPREIGFLGGTDADLVLNGKGADKSSLGFDLQASISSNEFLVPGLEKPIGIKIDLRGGLKDSIIAVRHLRLEGIDAELDGTGTYHIAGKKIDGRISLTRARLAPIFDLAGFRDLQGEGTAQFEFEGTLPRPKLDFTASLRSVSLPGFNLGDMDLEGSLQGEGNLFIENLQVANRDARLSLRGNLGVLDLSSDSYPSLRGRWPIDIYAEFADLRPQYFVPSFPYQGIFTGTIRAGGDTQHPKARIELRGEETSLSQGPPFDLAAFLNLSGPNLELQKLELKSKSSFLATRGNIQLFDSDFSLQPDPLLDLDISQAQLALEEFSEQGSGILSVSGNIRGRLDSPQGKMTLSGENLAWSKISLGNLETSLALQNGRVEVSSLVLRNNESSLKLSGILTLFDSGRKLLLEDPGLELEIPGSRINLSDFNPAMEGELSLKGSVSGSLFRPEGFLQASGNDLVLKGQKFSKFNLAAEMAGEKIEINPFLVALSENDTVNGTAEIDLASASYSLRISADQLPLDRITFLDGESPLPGFLSLDISGKGTFADPQAQGTLILKGLAVNHNRIDEIRIEAFLDRRTLLLRGKPGFDLQASLNLSSQNFTADASFQNSELSPLFNLAGITGFNGSVNGIISAAGKLTDPDSIQLRADLQDFHLRKGQDELLSSPEIMASLEQGTYILKESTVRFPSGEIILLKGRGGLEGAINLAISGRIPATLAGFISPHLNGARGAINIEGALVGSRADLAIEGEIILEKIGFPLPLFNQEVEEVEGRITFSPNNAKVEMITGKIDSGSFRLSGSMGLDALKPGDINVDLIAREIPLDMPGTLSLLFNSNLELRGDAGEPLLRGDIVLLDGIYSRDVELNLLQNFTERRREFSPADAGEPSDSFLDRISLQINLRQGAPFLVRNNVADLTLSPNLEIVGTAANPVVTGRATVEEGSLTYQKSNFTVERGSVEFLNPYQTEPTINIEGETSVQDIEISLKLNGTPSRLDFTLTSDPPQEHGDIVALLLFGKTLREIRIAERGASYSARQLLGEALAGAVSAEFREATGLDMVDLEFQGKSGDQGSDNVRITLGKELSRRLSVKYGAELKKGETVQKVTSEYKILEEVMVSAFQNTDGNFGGTLVFRMEFW